MLHVLLGAELRMLASFAMGLKVVEAVIEGCISPCWLACSKICFQIRLNVHLASDSEHGQSISFRSLKSDEVKETEGLNFIPSVAFYPMGWETIYLQILWSHNLPRNQVFVARKMRNTEGMTVAWRKPRRWALR